MTKFEKEEIIKKLKQLKTDPAMDELDKCWDSAIDESIELISNYEPF